MYDQLFKYPWVINRQLTSPLLKDRLRYLNHLAQEGAAKSTLLKVAIFQPKIVAHLKLKESQTVTPKEIENAAKSWARHQAQYKRFKYSNSQYLSIKRFIQTATAWLRFSGHLQLSISPPISPQAKAYLDYLRDERGLSEETIEYRRWNVQAFIDLIISKGYSLKRISIVQIENILLQKINQGKYARSTIQTYVSTVRAFLLYAQERGWCRAHLSEAIKLPRVYQHASLPSSPTWNEVKRLIRTTKNNSPADIRDRAILMLLSVYGLRSGEVIRLKLDDINWEKETIHIAHSKSGKPHDFPLDPTVGKAIIRYLQKVRHHSIYREVFLLKRAPYHPVKRSVLYSIVSRRWKPLNVPILHHGPHSLRHACATRLINHGIPLKAIADQLGHHNLESTRIYAKVDLSQLRKVASFNIGGFL